MLYLRAVSLAKNEGTLFPKGHAQKMLLRLGYDIEFKQSAPVPMVVLLSPSPSNNLVFQQPFVLQTEPPLPFTEFIDSFGNRCHRMTAPPGKVRLFSSFVVEHSGETDRVDWDAVQHPVEELPVETLAFLLGSRYCEVDILSDIAWELFGHLPSGWAKVQGICDWVHESVRYDADATSPRKTAYEVYQDRGGVCRDFQHLAITFCRAMNIPARYVSGYLGSIRVPHEGRPTDFHAWFEAYLGGQWHTFDARHNCPRTGRVSMAHGRDAVDVALATSFGAMKLERFKVIADEITTL